jgi:uncharacterized phage protein gp47/JayE
MALPLDVLIQPQSKEQVQAAILDLCVAAGLKVTTWKTGGVALTLVGVVSQLFAGFTSVVSPFVKGGFLDLAEAGYLTLLAFYVYGVSRIEAIYAAGDVSVTNTGGGLYTFAPGEFICSNPTTGITFANDGAFTVQPTGHLGSTQTVGVKAQTAGSLGTSVAGSISKVVTSIAGLTVTNPTALVGVDEESDPQLRQRCRDKLGSLSPNGARGAYEFVAKSAVDNTGAPIGVARVQVLAADGTGQVTMYVATATGALTGPALAIVADDVARQAVPDSVLSSVLNSTAVAASQVLTVYVDPAFNLSVADVRSVVQAGLLAVYPSVPIGGFKIYPSPNPLGALPAGWVAGRVDAMHPAFVQTLVSGGDFVMSPGQVAELGTVTAAVVYLGQAPV